MTWDVQVHPKAIAELEALDRTSQRRIAKAIDALVEDPLRKRPGADIKRIGALPSGSSLHRIRIGTRRSLYAVVAADRTVTVLLIDDRGRGYDRMIRTAKKRATKPN